MDRGWGWGTSRNLGRSISLLGEEESEGGFFSHICLLAFEPWSAVTTVRPSLFTPHPLSLSLISG